MATGDKEILEAFEETTKRNVNAVIAYSKETRKIARDQDTIIKGLQNQVNSQNELIEQFKKQMTSIQMKLYTKGI